MKRKYISIIIIAIALFFSIFIVSLIKNQMINKKSSQYEEKVNEIVEMNYEDQQKALNQIVEEGNINIQYSTNATFSGKVSKNFNIKNIKNNHHPIMFKIYNEKGENLYVSNKINPGYELNKIELEKELPKGKYNCRIQIGYTEEGNVSSSFPIYIEVL